VSLGLSEVFWSARDYTASKIMTLLAIAAALSVAAGASGFDKSLQDRGEAAGCVGAGAGFPRL
jgi:hypothetical protein